RQRRRFAVRPRLPLIGNPHGRTVAQARSFVKQIDLTTLLVNIIETAAGVAIGGWVAVSGRLQAPSQRTVRAPSSVPPSSVFRPPSCVLRPPLSGVVTED